MSVTLSIIMPVYNCEKYLDGTLQSLLPLSKDETNEIIIVNDGSTDSSDTIIRRYLPDFQGGVRYIVQENQGVSVARNTGIAQAAGEYLWFVDGDDQVFAENVPAVKQRVDAEGHDDIIQFQHRLSVFGGGTPPQRKEYSYDKPQYTALEFVRRYFSGNGFAWKRWIKRQLLEEHQVRFMVGGRSYEDANFMMKVLCYARTIRHIDIPLYNYFINPDSQSGGAHSAKKRGFYAAELQIDDFHYVKQAPISLELRRLFIGQLSVSTAWIIREATDDYARELYDFHRGSGLFPLRIYGTWKQKLQIALLNLSFPLYRKFCKVL
jgi:glycosyltransferase involved in cell wall biosynthesis